MDWNIWAIVPGLILLGLLVVMSIRLKVNRRYLWGGALLAVSIGAAFWFWDTQFGDAQGLAEAVVAGLIAVGGAIYGTKFGADLVLGEQRRLNDVGRLRSDLLQMAAAVSECESSINTFLIPGGDRIANLTH